MSDQEKMALLTQFAGLFEPVHQEIWNEGGCMVTEYDALWHLYNDKVRKLVIKEDDK